MEYNFKCPFCSQELSVDESVAGSETECPSCNNQLVIPTAAQAREAHLAVHAGSAAEAGALIQKPNRPLEVTAKSYKKIRVKSFRRHDLVKDGKDKFDETVSEFLQKTGNDNVVATHVMQYTNPEGQVDYGLIIVYSG